MTPPLPDRRGDCSQDSGNKGKNKGRRDLAADQRRAASIYWTEHKAISAAFERGEIGVGEMTERIDALPARGVTMCGWTQIADTETALMRQAREYLGAIGEDGKMVGAGYADMYTFSFHPVKPITTGEGGAVATDDPDLEAAALASEKVQNFLEGKQVRKVIVRAPKLVNIVAN